MWTNVAIKREYTPVMPCTFCQVLHGKIPSYSAENFMYSSDKQKAWAKKGHKIKLSSATYNFYIHYIWKLNV